MPRKVIHHDTCESGSHHEEVINHFWALGHTQNAHTAQEKPFYVMSKGSTFSMQSLLHFYFLKQLKIKENQEKNFKQAQKF